MAQVTDDDLPDADLIVFGSPCQGLSVAGKGKGFEDPRSGLFLHVVRLLAELKAQGRMPRFALWENVAGLLTARHVTDYNAALQHFAKLGALDISWRVLDAQGFGVPQRRRRVFTLVDFGGESAGEVLLDGEGSTRDSDAPRAERAGEPDTSGLAGDNQSPRGVYAFCGQGRIENLGVDVAPTLKSCTVTATSYSVDMGGGKGSARVREESTPTLTTGSPHAIAYGLTQQQFSCAPELSPTLTVCSSNCVAAAAVLRFLTPVECERLMSWPDNWTARGVDEHGREVTISNTQRYKMCGNGVVSNVAEWIGIRIIDANVQGA